MANGLLKPAAGRSALERRSTSPPPAGLRRQQARIGTLWQDLRLIEELSVQQNLNSGRLASWGWPRALLNLLLPLESEACAQALRQVDLDPQLLQQPVGELSGGQRQRVAIGPFAAPASRSCCWPMNPWPALIHAWPRICCNCCWSRPPRHGRCCSACIAPICWRGLIG